MLDAWAQRNRWNYVGNAWHKGLYHVHEFENCFFVEECPNRAHPDCSVTRPVTREAVEFTRQQMEDREANQDYFDFSSLHAAVRKHILQLPCFLSKDPEEVRRALIVLAASGRTEAFRQRGGVVYQLKYG